MQGEDEGCRQLRRKLSIGAPGFQRNGLSVRVLKVETVPDAFVKAAIFFLRGFPVLLAHPSTEQDAEAILKKGPCS